MIRLQCNYAAKHWTQTTGGQWRDGYERTGFFLQWLNLSYSNSCFNLNEALFENTWDEACCKAFPDSNFDRLWQEYQVFLENKN